MDETQQMSESHETAKKIWTTKKKISVVKEESIGDHWKINEHVEKGRGREWNLQPLQEGDSLRMWTTVVFVSVVTSVPTVTLKK